MRAVVRRELLTGAVVGLVIAAAFVPFALLGWGDEKVAVAVALAVLASCSIATIVAMTLPWLFQRRDRRRLRLRTAGHGCPGLSIAVYFAIAVSLVT